MIFETGKSDLKGGAAGNFDKLAAFLNEYEDRSVLIEGHTDDVGSDESNFNLSQRRANSVKSYLVTRAYNPTGFRHPAWAKALRLGVTAPRAAASRIAA